MAGFVVSVDIQYLTRIERCPRGGELRTAVESVQPLY